MSEIVYPDSSSNLKKREQVAQMFNHIASRYDLMNSVLSFGIYKRWMKKLVNQLRNDNPKLILDVATGTADIAIALMKINPEKVTGVDISEEMLAHGKIKIARKNLKQKIELEYADAEKLPFPENKFDAVSVAYGVRNFSHLEIGLKEMFRVLKPKGKIVILEFSKPKNIFLKKIFEIYFHKICPLIGGIITGNRKAYTYLPQSVKVFPDGKEFENILQQSGFVNTKCISLTFGIASLYSGYKP